TRPGSTALGRTLGLVAPTAAEYRFLGPNEPFLAALRSATGGAEMVTPLDPWQHDLRTTSRSTDLWPWLLVLALLLWPLDIALRRVSIGRRELAAAGSWVRDIPRRRGKVARRTATGETLLATRGRATSVETRAAMRRTEADVETVPATVTSAAPGEAREAPPSGAAVPAPAAPTPPSVPTKPNDPATPAPPPDTMARLRDAKRRARER
ncbi:MAG: hypothetical protein ACTS8Z_08355, partial [Candidatus Limnocylindrales bacterium]